MKQRKGRIQLSGLSGYDGRVPGIMRHILQYACSPYRNNTLIFGSDDSEKKGDVTVKTNKNNLSDFIIFFAVFLILSFSLPALVSAVEPDEYESDDTFKEANIIVIENETPQHHSFHKPEDADWVKFCGISSVKKYSVEARNLGKDCDVRLELYDTDGFSLLAYLDTMGDTQAEEILQYSFERDDIYYVRAIWSEPGSVGEDADTGYDLSIQIPDAPSASLFSYHGTVRDNFSQMPVGNAIIRTSENFSALSKADGSYEMYHPASPSSSIFYDLYANRFGYNNFRISVVMTDTGFYIPSSGKKTDPEIIPWDGIINMTPKGDINKDNSVNLADAVLVLQILAGMEKQGDSGEAVSGDNKIGTADAVTYSEICSSVEMNAGSEIKRNWLKRQGMSPTCPYTLGVFSKKSVFKNVGKFLSRYIKRQGMSPTCPYTLGFFQKNQFLKMSENFCPGT